MRWFLLLPAMLLAMQGWAQNSLTGAKNRDQAILLGLSYGLASPAGELADRFGNFGSIGLNLGYSAKGSPWIFQLDGRYLFGSEVKQDVLANLRTEAGFIIGNDRDPADIQLRMRGYYAGVTAGRILSFGQNPRAGLFLAAGGGYMSHRIRIQYDPQRTVNQLVGGYRKGYDRLTAGPALTQFVGYLQLSNDGRLNFFVGAEAMQAFTTNQRAYDFATAGSLKESRLDISFGLRAGIILPFYQGLGEDIYYR